MNIRGFFKGFTGGVGGTKKYYAYAAVALVVLALIGYMVRSKYNAELEAVRAEYSVINEGRQVRAQRLSERLTQLQATVDRTDTTLHDLEEETLNHQVEIRRLEIEDEKKQSEIEGLEGMLYDANEDIARNQLKDGFIAEQIVDSLETMFPRESHIFFSKTQADLFRTNPVTANLIYSVIMDNAVRIKLIEKMQGHTDNLMEQIGFQVNIINIQKEEISGIEFVNYEYERAQEELEAALSIERTAVTNLEKQIAIMTKRNMWEKILPSFNFVVGPYYDPIRNTAGVGVALGLGWRF